MYIFGAMYDEHFAAASMLLDYVKQGRTFYRNDCELVIPIILPRLLWNDRAVLKQF